MRVSPIVEDEPEQEALFHIEGPDEDGCVWIYGASTGDPWAQNLGPCRKVAEVLSQWLGSVDQVRLQRAGVIGDRAGRPHLRMLLEQPVLDIIFVDVRSVGAEVAWNCLLVPELQLTSRQKAAPVLALVEASRQLVVYFVLISPRFRSARSIARLSKLAPFEYANLHIFLGDPQ